MGRMGARIAAPLRPGGAAGDPAPFLSSLGVGFVEMGRSAQARDATAQVFVIFWGTWGLNASGELRVCDYHPTMTETLLF